jgi:hypothetical protein
MASTFVLHNELGHPERGVGGHLDGPEMACRKAEHAQLGCAVARGIVTCTQLSNW